MKKILPLFTCSVLSVFLFIMAPPTQAAAADHVVISEIQLAGGSATDEFVELYNPTSTDIDLSGWKLFKKTASASATETELITLRKVLPSHGFYLIAHSTYDGSVTADDTYTEGSLSTNNSVVLRDDESGIVDLVGMDDSQTFETATITSPVNNRSIERKAKTETTAADMVPTGAHEFLGNGEDTNNNSLDFVRHMDPTISNPQNTSSNPESIGETPTPPPVEPPNPPEDQPNNPPTEQPEATPGSTPEEEPTPQPEATPSEEPTTPPVTPPVNPPTPPTNPRRLVGFFPLSKQVCFLEYREVGFGWLKIRLPKLQCGKIK